MKLRYSPLVLTVIVACSPKPAAPPPTPQQVTYTATDFKFTGPDTIAPGMTTLRLVNQGTQDHHMILGRLDDGKTMADVMTFMASGTNADPGFVKMRGAAGVIEVGDSTASTTDLEPGTYMVVCFLPDPADGKAHVMKGMMKQIVVTGTPHVAPVPVADVEMKLMDFTYDIPTLTAGTHTFHLVNQGPQYHEAQLVRLNEGATAKTYLAALAPGAKTPPPGKMMGGGGALSAGKDNYWTATLTPGNYVFFCMIPDTASGTPHMMKGMVKEFTIAAK